MEAVTELIIAGEFDTEMVEETIQNQEGKNPDYIPKKSNEITPDRIRKPIDRRCGELTKDRMIFEEEIL